MLVNVPEKEEYKLIKRLEELGFTINPVNGCQEGSKTISFQVLNLFEGREIIELKKSLLK